MNTVRNSQKKALVTSFELFDQTKTTEYFVIAGLTVSIKLILPKRSKPFLGSTRGKIIYDQHTESILHNMNYFEHKIPTAVGLLLPGKLAKHADSKGNKTITK